jgi:hypothetical protein
VGIRQSLPFGVVEQRSRKTDVPSLVLAIESSRMWDHQEEPDRERLDLPDRRVDDEQNDGDP